MMPSNPNDDLGREFVQSELKRFDLDAVVIPESENKTPDLALPDPKGRILIEVKLKTDDGQIRELANSPAGTIRSYKVSDIETLLRNSWHQIDQYSKKSESDFAVIWLVAVAHTHRPTSLMRPAAMTVLYGVQEMEGETVENDQFYRKDCFFFGHFFFFRRHGLHGVVLQDDLQLTLCLNPFAKGFDSFIGTRLVELFRRQFELIDPAEKERAGECFIADCDIPRKDANAVVRYLKIKYKLATVDLNKFGPLVNLRLD